MKKLIALFVLALMLTTGVSAQKFGYVDTQEILNSMDEYNAAKTAIDQQSQAWQQELEGMYKNIEAMYRKFEEEAVLLPDDIKKQRKEEIYNEERKAKEFKQKKFGYDGELYKLQDEKIKPIQDKVFDAVEQMAKEKKLNFIFDKASNTGMIFTDELFNRTPDVKQLLNIK